MFHFVVGSRYRIHPKAMERTLLETLFVYTGIRVHLITHVFSEVS